EILAGAEEKDLNACLAAFLIGSNDINLVIGRKIDRLAGLDMRHGLQPVAIDGGLFEIERIGRGLHLSGELFLQLEALARQEAARLIDDIEITLAADQPDAGRGGALALILQAGPRAVLKSRIRSGAEWAQQLKGRQRLIYRAGGGKRAVIFPLAAAGGAMLGDLRPVVITGDQDIGKGFVIAQ